MTERCGGCWCAVTWGSKRVSLFLRSYACSYCRVPGVCFSLCVFAKGSIKILQFKERMLAFGQNQGSDEG